MKTRYSNLHVTLMTGNALTSFHLKTLIMVLTASCVVSFVFTDFQCFHCCSARLDYPSFYCCSARLDLPCFRCCSARFNLNGPLCWIFSFSYFLFPSLHYTANINLKFNLFSSLGSCIALICILFCEVLFFLMMFLFSVKFGV